MYCSLSAEVQFDLKITLRVFCKSMMKNYQMVRFLTVTRLSLYSLKHFLKIHQFVIKQELLNCIYMFKSHLLQFHIHTDILEGQRGKFQTGIQSIEIRFSCIYLHLSHKLWRCFSHIPQSCVFGLPLRVLKTFVGCSPIDVLGDNQTVFCITIKTKRETHVQAETINLSKC